MQQIRAEQGCSFTEARRLAAADTQLVRSTATNVSARKMINRAVQTDLTWPLAATDPVAITNKNTMDSQSQKSRHTGKEANGCSNRNVTILEHRIGDYR